MLQGNKAGWSDHLSGSYMYLTEGGISCWSFVYDLCMCFDFYFRFSVSMHKWLSKVTSILFIHTFVVSLLYCVLSTYYTCCNILYHVDEVACVITYNTSLLCTMLVTFL